MCAISVVMRSCNSVRALEATLRALLEDAPPDLELLCIDSASEDGSWELLGEFPVRRIQIQGAEYLPGAVLNLGASLTCGEVIVFLNDDATPARGDFLQRLSQPLISRRADAVYARQLPRSGARLEVRAAYRRAFPPSSSERGGAQTSPPSWRNFFSMVASAVRRETWAEFPLDETLSFSEDIAWGRTLRQAGKSVAYVPDAEVFHSHDYSLSQSFHRFAGEGAADQLLFPQEMKRGLAPWARWARSTLRELLAGLRHRDPGALVRALPHGIAQSVGYAQGARLARRGLAGRAATAPSFARLRAAEGQRVAERDVGLDRLLAQLARRFSPLRPELEALLLVGSFGRGEGSLRCSSSGRWIPSNNIDLLAVGRSRRSCRDLEEPIARIRREIEEELGALVDVSIVSKRSLARAPASQFFHDAGRGHRVLLGNPRGRRYWRVPELGELGPRAGLHLLLNRGILLLANDELLAGTPAPWQWNQALRHGTKAVLGLGDAVLLMRGRYDHRDGERRRRVAGGALGGGSKARHYARLYEKAAELRASAVQGDGQRRLVRSLGRDARSIGGPLLLDAVARLRDRRFGSWSEFAEWVIRERPCEWGDSWPRRIKGSLGRSRLLRHQQLAALTLLLFGDDREAAGEWFGAEPTRALLRSWSRLEDPRLAELLRRAGAASELKSPVGKSSWMVGGSGE